MNPDRCEQERRRLLAAERQRRVVRAPYPKEGTPEPRPLKRLVMANGEAVVVEITESMVVIRPRRSGKSICEITWGQLILRSLNAPKARGRR